MYIVAKISIIILISRSVIKASTINRNFPSRLYLPTWQNPEPKNRARTSDIEAVLENDLQVIPLAADHDQRNGFQYQPIISRQYSRVFTESPRYLQSAVPNLPQSENTLGLGSPISNVNEVKPITKSQLSPDGVVACSSTQKANNQSNESASLQRGSYWCLRNLQNQESTSRLNRIPVNPLRRRILTINDEENNTQRQGLHLRLTPPLLRDGISRISRHRIDKVQSVYLPPSSTKLVAPNAGSWSKKTILIDQASAYNDDRNIKPVIENNEYRTNHDDYRNPHDYNEEDYQLGNRNSAGYIGGSFNGPFKQYVRSNNAGEFTCRDIIRRPFMLQNNLQGYNYGYNTHEHTPTNPILALLLSHYGKYLPAGIRDPRIYSYMAVNNIHNNKPFGSYKLTGDDDGSPVQ